jgi:hypothetical protein
MSGGAVVAGLWNVEGAMKRVMMMAAATLTGMGLAWGGRAASLPATQLPPTWTYQYLYNGTYWPQIFVGRDPQRDVSTTVPVYLIPVRMIYTDTTGKALSYSPLSPLPGGGTAVQTVLASPLFQPIDFTFGGKDIGVTQYLDAFQKVNLWNIGGSLPGYHILLGTPVVGPEQTIRVPAPDGLEIKLVYGARKVLVAEVELVDKKLQAMLPALNIPAGALPVFLMEQTYFYVLGNGCCLAFYHNVTSAGQPYVQASYMLDRGAFSQDVAGLSDVLAEWLDNPYLYNTTPCGAYDPGSEFYDLPHFGAFAYRNQGQVYHLEDLGLLPFFLDTSGVTLGGLHGLRDGGTAVCSPQQ